MLNSYLPKTLFISLTLHTLFICSTWLMHLPTPTSNKKIKGVEISYRPLARKKAVDMKEHPIKPTQQLDLKSRLSEPMNGSIPIRGTREISTLSKDFMMRERRREQIRSTAIVNKISVTQIKSEKINNPAYAAYNDMVRSSIENKVYENYRKMDAGVVYLTFILGSDGMLKGAQIIEEKTHASDQLKELSLKSLKDSQFPPFLKGMTLPEYTFNIEIQYQVRD